MDESIIVDFDEFDELVEQYTHLLNSSDNVVIQNIDVEIYDEIVEYVGASLTVYFYDGSKINYACLRDDEEDYDFDESGGWIIMD